MEIWNKTIEELKKAGWYEGRKIDISESGRIFKSTGWAGENALEALDNIFREKGTLIWDKFEG